MCIRDRSAADTVEKSDESIDETKEISAENQSTSEEGAEDSKEEK